MKGHCIPDPLLGLWDDVCWPEWACPRSPQEEHMQALTNSDAMTSALTENAMDTMHMIAWEDVEVLASNPRPH